MRLLFWLFPSLRYIPEWERPWPYNFAARAGRIVRRSAEL